MWQIRSSGRFATGKGVTKFFTCGGRSVENFFTVFTIIITLEILVAVSGLVNKAYIESSIMLGIGLSRVIVMCYFQYRKVKGADKEVLLETAMVITLGSGILAVGNLVVLYFAQNKNTPNIMGLFVTIDVLLSIIYCCGFTSMIEDEDDEVDPAERNRDDYFAKKGREQYLRSQAPTGYSNTAVGSTTEEQPNNGAQN